QRDRKRGGAPYAGDPDGHAVRALPFQREWPGKSADEPRVGPDIEDARIQSVRSPHRESAFLLKQIEDTPESGRMKKKNLVVIGNGMAGARTVEEILARGGGEMFDITMFGDEPYGNYNRILLSNVLNGSQDENEIFLNPIEWYRENNITLHVGVYAESIL